MLRSTKIKFFLSLFFVASVTGVVAFSQSPVSALSGSQWNAGNMIDDGIFYDNNAMSAADIQNFLNAKMPSCDTSGSMIYSGSQTRAQYGASRGYPAPFICLKDYFENPTNQQNNLNGVMPSGGLSAAQIIKQASDTYKINPRVMIILLQKEQTLVTDDWPFPTQYKSATGYGCPDTAACDSQYYGFYNQVTNAARQFRLYANNPTSYRYKPYQTNYIQYNPNSSCGGTNVYIQNSATAALYNYTPYQPNQSALDNLYGLGDACSAYGNRNFWRLFSDWFGDLYVPYIASNYKQTDAVSISPGQTKDVAFYFKNAGNSAWQDGPTTADAPKVHLSTSSPTNRSSIFAANWPAPQRPNITFTYVYEADGVTLAQNQHVVNPGQIVQYTVPFTVPDGTSPGTYTEAFTPVRDGAQNWNMAAEASTNITVLNKYKAEYVSQNQTKFLGFQNSVAGNSVVKFRNSGYAAWKDDVSKAGNEPAVHLATYNTVNRASSFAAQWPTKERPNLTFTRVLESDGVTLAQNQHVVLTGQIAEYSITITIPDTLSWNTYSESFGIVADGYTYWDMGASYHFDVQVNESLHSAAYYTQSAYPKLSLDESVASYLGYKNTGNSTWYDDISATAGVFPVHLATDVVTNRTSQYQFNWTSPQRPNVTFTRVYESDGVTLAQNQHIVTPGQIGWYQFSFKNYNLAPNQLSREAFTPVLEGSTRWNMTSQKVWLDVTGK